MTDEIAGHLAREIQSAPAGVPVADLSRKLNVPQSTLLDSSRRLERDGWLTIDGASGNEPKLVPSRRAQAAVPVMVDASRWMLVQALNGFSHEEIDVLADQLSRILRNLDAPIGEDEGPLVG